MKRNLPYLGLIALLVGLDQLSKSIIHKTLALHSSRAVIPGFFNLSYVRNRGAIFGFFSQSPNKLVFILLTTASLAALSIVLFYFLKAASSDIAMKISLALILAGAFGNQIDRILRGYVIDFLDFHIKQMHWPFFNLADSCITVGALILIYIFFFKKGAACSQSS